MGGYGDRSLYVWYWRQDRGSPWLLQGFDSSPGEAEERAGRKRRDMGGGLTMVRRWAGTTRLEPTLPPDWRE